MKKILVTGGAGFIGSNFIRQLLSRSKDISVINLDALTYAGRLENLEDIQRDHRYVFIRGDICNRDLVSQTLREHQIDTIAHFAAETHVDRSIIGPGQFVQTNVIGTHTLLEAARAYWLEQKAFPLETVRFHHVSTDEVFGALKPDDPPFSDDTPYAPRSPYSASKAASDHLVRAYYHTYGLPVTISNCTNNYGPYQFPEKLIPLMIVNGITGKPLPVYGDGQQIRDWLYVTDHCDAILKILEAGKTGETYLIGGNNQPANLDIVLSICQILDDVLPESRFSPHRQLIQFVTDRPGHDRRYAMDIQKIRDELGWQPKESLVSGLEKTIRWYLGNSNWVQSVSQESHFQEWIQRNYSQRR